MRSLYGYPRDSSSVLDPNNLARHVLTSIQDINRHFPKVLDLGANSCNIARALVRENPDPDPLTPVSTPLASRITELVAADSSESLLYRDADHDFNKELNITRQVLGD